ncbi:MAG TPA: alcohol dehydrogenase catalytic domain-containing protein [Nitrososphaerales archaeon]|nr:alcohol dehydrogenase catalytic domain-containing protein [Nitrososphaerales archaeon]
MRLVAGGQPLEEMSVETPSPVPGSVLIKVKAAGVCHTDIHLVSGGYELGEGKRLPAIGGGTLLPLTPGHEIAGEVAALGNGSDSSGFHEGDQVVVYPWIGCGACRKCRSGRENLCEGSPKFLGFQKDGGYAEYTLVPQARYLLHAEVMDLPHAATLSCSGLTAFSAIKKCRLEPDDLLLIVGAGGLGLTAVQIAKKTTRARIAVADIDDSKLQLASSLGADWTFNTLNADSKALLAKVRDLNQGKGADAVVDFVGKPSTTSLGLRLLGHEGRLVLVGLLGGAAQVPLPILPLYGTQIIGNFTGTLAELADLIEMVKNEVVMPLVSGCYRLEEANEVLTKLERGEIKGRAVLVP